MDIRKVNKTVEKLSEAVKGMRKCLECAICYDTLQLPVKTLCGHSFCRACIAKLVSQKNAPCPLCKANLSRRSFSDDKHKEICIEKTDNLLIAIGKDTGYSGLEQIVKSKNTRECHSTLDNFVMRTSQSSSGTAIKSKNASKPKPVTVSGKRKGRSTKVNKKLQKNVPKDVKNENTDNSSRLSTMSQATDSRVHNNENLEVEDKTLRVEAWLDDLNYARRGSSTPISDSFGGQHEEQSNLPPSTSYDAKNDLKQAESCKVKHKKVIRNETSNKEQAIATTKLPKSAMKVELQTGSGSLDNVSESTSVSNAQSLNKTKNTWSCVKTFGIDMRSRKKKLKSLNVSIENTGHLKSAGSVKAYKGTTNRRKSTDSKTNDCSASEAAVETVLQSCGPLNSRLNQTLEDAETKPCQDNSAQDSELNISNVTDNSSKPHIRKNASFIMMPEGDWVHIQNLNHSRMNDIIGVANDDTTKESGDTNVEDKSENVKASEINSKDGRDEKSSRDCRLDRKVLSLKKRSDSSTSVSNSSQISSPIPAIGPIRDEKIREVVIKNFSEPQNDARTPLVSSNINSPILTNTPFHTSGRLSLKKNSSEKTAPRLTRNLSLSAAKRNLTAEILKSSPISNENQNTVESLNQKLNKSSYVVKSCSQKLDESKAAKSSNRSSLVAFKKLGRVIKIRHRSTQFFYTSRLLRERSLRTLQRLEQTQVLYQNVPPANDNDIIWISDLPLTPVKKPAAAPIPTSESKKNHFPSKNTSTESGIYEETTFLRKTEQEIVAPVEKRKTSNPLPDFKSQESMEVVFVTLEKNEDAKDNLNGKKSNAKTSSGAGFEGPKAKLLSPAKDSQLMFLSIDSPVSEETQLRSKALPRVAEVIKVSQPTTNTGGQKSLSDVKLSNSQALLRRSQGSDRNSPTRKDSTPPLPMEVTMVSSESSGSSVIDRKRKRLDSHYQESVQSIKKRSKAEGGNKVSLANPISSSSSDSQQRNGQSSRETAGRTISPEKPSDSRLVKLSSESDLPTNTHKQRIKGSRANRVDESDESDLPRIDRKSDWHERDELPRKKYRRIVRAASSDTDSNNEVSSSPRKSVDKARTTFDEGERNATTKAPGTWSGKTSERRESSSSDDDVDAIVEQWCSGLPTAQRFIKRSKESAEANEVSRKSLNNSLTNLSAGARARRSLERYYAEAGSMDFDCVDLDGTRKTTPQAREEEIDPRDRAIDDIIGCVRQIQSDASTGKSARNLMEDNFDEAIANVDTQALMNASPRKSAKTGEKNAQTSGRGGVARTMERTKPLADSYGQPINDEDSSKVEKSRRGATNVYKTFCGTSGPVSGSDEAKIGDKNAPTSVRGGVARTMERARSVVDSFGRPINDEDSTNVEKSQRRATNVCKTFCGTSGQFSGSDKENDHGCFRAKQRTSLNLSRNDESQNARDSSRKTNVALDGAEKISCVDHRADLSAKESSSMEHDTIMNVTQYSNMLRQIEEDLLGPAKPATSVKNLSPSAEAKKPGDGLETPKKISEGTKDRDLEQSLGEDDIIENTPEVKSKTRPQCSSGTRNRTRTSCSSPFSASTATPQRLPIDAPPPLHQSTPKTSSSVATVRVDAAAAADDDEDGLVLACSKLTSREIERVKELARICRGRYVGQFAPDVTHVVVKMDKANNATDRTLKYLQGVAHRKWIIGYDWVLESIANGRLVNEEPYEAVDNSSLEPGPRNSRLRAKGIFEDFAFLCVGSYTHMSIEQCQDLLRAAGATLVETPKKLVAVKSRLKPVALYSDNDYDASVDWCRNLRIAAVAESWLVDCVSQFKLVSFAGYLVNMAVSELSADYPPELLVEENESDDSDDSDNETLR